MNPAYLLDPTLMGGQQQVDQQQQLANLLIQQGIAPDGGTQMAGQVAIKRSPMEGIAKLAALLSGQNMQQTANQQQQALAQRQAGAMAQMFGMGAPGQSPQGAPQGAPGQMPIGTPGQAPQQPQGAPQGMPAQGGSGPMSVSGASPMTNLMDYATDPAAHMKAVMDQFQQTPEMKMAAAAYGVGTPAYNAALREQVQKAGYIAPIDAKPGTPVLDPRTMKPVFFAPKTADGINLNFDNPLAPTASAIPGYAGANAGIVGAQEGATQDNKVFTGVPGPNGSPVSGRGVDLFPSSSNPPLPPDSGPPQFNIGGGPNAIATARAAIASHNSPEAQALLAQFDKQYPPSAAAPAAPTQGRVITGQSPGDAAAQKDTATSIVGRNQSIIADGNAAPQDIESLNRMGELANGSNFGPGASNVAKWKAMAAQFPGMGLITDPSNLEQQQTNVTLMKKYMSGMAGRMSGSSGTGTDARLQNAIDSLPNDAAPDAAIKQVVPMLIAQRTARMDEAGLRQQLGDNSQAISTFENKWRNAYNPLAYEATLATKGMTPAQAQAYVAKTYTPAQAAQIAQSRAALRGLGVQF